MSANTSEVPPPMLPPPQWIVRYGGMAVKFVQNACGKQFELVADGDASVFPSDALANQAIGKWHISGRAFTDRIF